MGPYRKESVWSDNEDHMSLDNKPHDMMGLDALSENIISAESHDENKEFFYSNEFLYLNEDTEPDTGLNLQAGRAYANSF